VKHNHSGRKSNLVGAVAVQLAEHADAIRALGKRVVADVTEIGGRLTKAKRIAGHGNWLSYLDREFGWTDKTALNFMRVYELSLKSENFSNLDLPISGLYLLAAPSTPAETRDAIIDRAAKGEKLTHEQIKDTIQEARKPAMSAWGRRIKQEAETVAEEGRARKLEQGGAHAVAELADPAVEIATTEAATAVTTGMLAATEASDAAAVTANAVVARSEKKKAKAVADFNECILFVVTGCTAIADCKIPPLESERCTEVEKDLTDAIAALGKLRRRVREAAAPTKSVALQEAEPVPDNVVALRPTPPPPAPALDPVHGDLPPGLRVPPKATEPKKPAALQAAEDTLNNILADLVGPPTKH
jgi:hypothetical protein